MFDDEKIAGQAPGNLPFAPEPPQTGQPAAGASSAPSSHGPDALNAGLLKRKMDEETVPPGAPASSPFTAPMPGQQPMAAMTYATKEPVLGKILAGFLSIVGVGIVVVGGWYGYTNVVKPMLVAKNGAPSSTVAEGVVVSSSSATNVGVVSNTPAVYRPTVSTSSIQAQNNNDTLLSGEQPDTDRDGLPDRRERELGIDPNKADTDGDGLSDGDEVLIWLTDPLNPDSDGDGFKDGREVNNGYNPLGPGKLFGTTASSSSPAAQTSTLKSPTTVPTTSTSAVVSNSPSNIPSL